MTHLGVRSRTLIPILAAGAVAAAATFALVVPENGPGKTLAYRHPDLFIAEQLQRAQDVAGFAADPRLADLGVDAATSQLDLRTGRWATLLPAKPLLPGKGVGNQLSWSALGIAEPKGERALAAAAWDAFAAWLDAHRDALGVDPAEVVSPGRVTVIHPGYIQIYAPRIAGGVRFRDTAISATIKYGNLILFGAENWGDLDTDALASVSQDNALAVVTQHVGRVGLGRLVKAPELIFVPVDRGAVVDPAQIGRGLGYRLAWVFRPNLGEEGAVYEALVDAHTGELLSFRDTRDYVATARDVKGGVYPVSNDGIGADGTEQAGWPMPFSNVTTPGGPVTTDIGGNLPTCVDGSITANLVGQYMTINDTCGAISLSAAGDINFGTSAGTDCTTPGFGGAGNTHSSRSAFHELNMMKAMARGYLPDNTWLQGNLTANVNLNQTCNAYWNGATVNFFKHSANCNNTGEIAAVFDHEWGHGLDNNDANGFIQNPGEAIADIYASLRLQTSCLGRHFFNSNCSGYGNPCLNCTGIRQIDWAQHTTPQPLTIDGAGGTVNIHTLCGGGGSGPCGAEVHCEGQLVGQVSWDLWNRDLTAGAFNYPSPRAHEVASQVIFEGSGLVSDEYACTAGTGGCGANTSYMQYLAADDDDGVLSNANGTPHMSGFNASFNRHEIACNTLTVNDSGCSGTPTSATTVTPTPLSRGVSLAWTSVSGATNYRVYRSDGVHQCDFGKVLLDETAGLSFVDSGLQPGRHYFYQVMAMGPSHECIGPMSSCTDVLVPTTGGDLVAQGSQAQWTILSSEGDPFLDNCEEARIRVPVSNIGTSSLTNVRIVSASSPSHPSTVFLDTFPKAISSSLVSCGAAAGQIFIVPEGMNPNDTLQIHMDLTSDELSPVTIPVDTSFSLTEGDFLHVATHTFDFESDSENWLTTAGTFNRTNAAPGGAGGAGTFYFASSTFLDNQCDVVRSPNIRLFADSTMVMSENYDIEPNSGQWFDRANIGVVDPSTGVRSVVTPSSGKAYDASGPNGTCGTDGQPGWAGSHLTWQSSNWTAAALLAPSFAGRPTYLQINYGTDGSVNGAGFRWDQLTLTDFDIQVADGQSNTCGVSNIVFIDDFETGDASRWSFIQN